MKRITFLILILFELSSCVSHKNLLNLQQTKGSNSIIIHQKLPYLVQPQDLLDIKVSSIDPQSVAIFNKDIGGNNSQVNPASIFLNGYSVTDSGFINLPLIGNIKVSGMEISKIKSIIESKMIPFYKYVSVDVKLMNFRVTILGEVNSQGTFQIYNEEANILQVIGMAGGITDLGNREKIRIVRKKGDHSEISYLNITNADIIHSPNYYMQPNDIIYVEPLKVKPVKVNAPTVQIAISALTFIIVLLNFLSIK